jgi:hypothetical protein
MSEIKTEIKQNPDGSYTITDAHSTADVVRWLLTQDSKETILYLLGDTPQRKPLTDKQILADETLRYYFGLNGGAGPVSKQGRRIVNAIEAAHGIKGEA